MVVMLGIWIAVCYLSVPLSEIFGLFLCKIGGLRSVRPKDF